MRIILLAVALLTAGCAGVLPPAAPQQVANQTTLDERFAIGLETGYALAAELGAMGFRTGLIPTTRSPAAQRPDFCDQVVAGNVSQAALDRGGRIMALDCRAYAAVRATRTAYDAGNAANYREAYDRGMSLLGELRRLISGR